VDILKHPDAQAFLAKIRSEDDDDTNRLVFADWLEERGEPHLEAWARLIRAQIEMAIYWPYPTPPKELDQVNPAFRRAYWLAESTAAELIKEFQPRWLGYKPVTNKVQQTIGSPYIVKWRRGLPGLKVSDVKELRKYQSRPSWPLYTSLEIQSVRAVPTAKSNDQSTLVNLIESNQFNELVFLAPCSNNVARWISELPLLSNLRRLGFDMWDIGPFWIQLLTSKERGVGLPSFYHANPQLKIVLRPLNTFTTSGISALAQAFGQRCVVDTSKCQGGAYGARR
jgi:uncharacterized protein (TIGR02996 family)